MGGGGGGGEVYSISISTCTYLHVAWFDEPWLVSQHLVDGEQVEYLGGDILQPLQPLRVTVVLEKFSFKNRYLHHVMIGSK